MTEQAANQQQAANQFGLQRIYIKDLSFESPNSPGLFKDQWKPEVNLDLNSRSSKIETDLYEVVLSMTVTAKLGDTIGFIVELQQAGLFLIKGMETKQVQALLGSYCPNVLFPYAREVVSDVVGKGGFPQLLLAPVNFDAIYAEAMKKQAAEAACQSLNITLDDSYIFFFNFLLPNLR